MTIIQWARGRAVVLALALMLGALGRAGCVCNCPSETPYVAVREEQFRSAEHALPLTPAARAELLLFLGAGGNRNSIEDGVLVDVVYPDAAKRWGGALEMLGDPELLDVADLRTEAYARWFEGEPLGNVIDARKSAPSLIGVHALRSELRGGLVHGRDPALPEPEDHRALGQRGADLPGRALSAFARSRWSQRGRRR